MQDLNTLVEREQYPEVKLLISKTTAPAKVAGQLPSRLPLTLDVLITGTATLNVYGSNIADSADSTDWGAPIATYTASTKVIMENEPWSRFMLEFAAVSGTASAALGG